MGRSLTRLNFILVAVVIFLPAGLYAKDKKVKQAKESNCVACHKDMTPGVVKQWKDSVMGKEGVGCEDCHGSAHQNTGDF
ncbi:MAG: hypothetical protein FJ088_02210, partial [Deltaproteobacteria bacterium]|nr:hypothetical protein [Deltaproteobacteria bacterium]